MAAPKFKKNNVEQTVNLKEILGFSAKDAPELAELFGQKIIQKIVDRTSSGKGMSFSGDKGVPVSLSGTPYSKAYKDSLPFKAAGKTENVNLTLTGDMLGLLTVKSVAGDNVTIGWEDKKENNKAFNHSVGDTVPRRPFFGVNKTELEQIKKELMPEIKEALKIRAEEGKRPFQDFVLSLIKDVEGQK